MKNVFIKLSFALVALFCCAFSLSAQINITGTVVDASGETVPGVNITVKGSLTGAVTDMDGKYSINAPNADAVLVFSFVGYTPQEIVVGTQTAINVTLAESATELDEVVVVGYGTQKRENLTGSVGTADSEVLENRPVANIGQALQGAVAGLNVTSANGTPGGGATFSVRGVGSLDGGGAPLVLVDGIPMDPNVLNPADIKSVSVLKDAASAAIYGARGAFGVVLITTKTGYVTRKPVVSAGVNYSINTPTVRPQGMNSMDYANYMNASWQTAHGRNFFSDEHYAAIKAHYEDPSKPSVIWDTANNRYDYSGNTDWYDELNKRTYPMQQYNLSVAGGTENVRYYASAGYFNQKGMSKWADESYERFNVMQNIMYRINNWLEAGLRSSVNITDNEYGGTTNNGVFDAIFSAKNDVRPTMPLRHPDGNFSGAINSWANFTNPAAVLSLGGNNRHRSNNLTTTALIILKPFEGLKINGDYTYDFVNYVAKSHRKTYYDHYPDGRPQIFPHTNPNRVRYGEDDDRFQSFNVYAEYEKTFADKHAVKAMAGFNQEWATSRYIETIRENLISNDIGYINSATGNMSVNDDEQEWAVRGAFFRLNYAYDDKYLLEVAGRYDGSSKFPKADRFAFFPSISAGWRISKENFWQGISHIIPDFKVRASYGSLGNQAVASNYPYILSYGRGNVNYPFANEREMGITAPGLVSGSLTWETVKQTGFAVDAAFLDKRLTATFEWYNRTTAGMLMAGKTLPSILAVAEPRENAADLKTIGAELILGWKDKLDNGINYGVDLSIWDYTTEITKYDNPTRDIGTIPHYVGKKMGEIWGFETAGLFASDAEAAAWDQSAIHAISYREGDLKLADLDGKAGITRGANTVDDPGDRKIIGNSTPRFQYGLRLTGEWKGFDVAVFFQGTMKRQVQPASVLFLNHYNDEWDVPQQINQDYWRPDNKGAYFPRPRANGGGIVTQAQTRFLQNAAYIRMKQLSVGYTIPFKYTDKLGISQCRVYFAGNNLWEAHGMIKSFDPELAQINAYPFYRSFSFGANLTF
jgi:TonB-linked SusC/RagA family outer membrane protein